MKRKIVLASQSPRRKQLLEQIGIVNFEVRESEYEEDMTLNKSPEDLAEFLALNKAEEVAEHYESAVVIAGDTMLFLNNKVLGKPKSEKEAQEMLEKFSGQRVECVSGLAIIDTATNKKIVTHNTAQLQFRELSRKEIKKHLIAEKKILTLAGGFNILNVGAILIESMEGDFFSIMGLPLTKLYLGLEKMGVDVLEDNE
jgi:septum formation protein